MCRFVSEWRYLLLACLLLGLVIANEYRLASPPQPPQSQPTPAAQLPSLRDKLQKVEQLMTGPEVLGILGPPKRSEQILPDTAVWRWQEGQDIAIVWVCTYSSNGCVVGKSLHTK